MNTIVFDQEWNRSTSHSESTKKMSIRNRKIIQTEANALCADAARAYITGVRDICGGGVAWTHPFIRSHIILRVKFFCPIIAHYGLRLPWASQPHRSICIYSYWLLWPEIILFAISNRRTCVIYARVGYGR